MISQGTAYRTPIIDCHVHLNNYAQINRAGREFISLEERFGSLIESMEDNNIGYSIILSSYKVDVDRPSTSKIIDITKNMVINLE
jgi:hypothetical protein